MPNKLEKLVTEISALVEKYSDDESFIYELRLSTSNKLTNEIYTINMGRDKHTSIINVLKFKPCGNYVLTLKRDENGK